MAGDTRSLAARLKRQARDIRWRWIFDAMQPCSLGEFRARLHKAGETPALSTVHYWLNRHATPAERYGVYRKKASRRPAC